MDFMIISIGYKLFDTFSHANKLHLVVRLLFLSAGDGGEAPVLERWGWW